MFKAASGRQAELLALAKDAEGVALGVYATLVGALQLARAVEGTELSDRVLEAGKEAARTLARPIGSRQDT